MLVYNKNKIAILLATYNSEIYLSEQIYSIISQDYFDWTLYIRDDGSMDSTLDIIQYFTSKYQNIKLLTDDKNHRGPMASFAWMMERVSSEYYMFCDHDDIWLPYKISLSFSRIKKLEIDHPSQAILIGTNLKIINKEKLIVSDSMFKYAGIDLNWFRKDIDYLYVANPFVGCTLFFNDIARNSTLPIDKNAIMHDWWMALKISSCGVLDIIDEPTILYRLHGDNTCGTQIVGPLNYYLKSRLLRLDDILRYNVLVMKMLYSANICTPCKYILLKMLQFYKRFF